MKHTSPAIVAIWLALGAAMPLHAQTARDTISVVGSSTVYPFTTTVAEKLGRPHDPTRDALSAPHESHIAVKHARQQRTRHAMGISLILPVAVLA